MSSYKWLPLAKRSEHGIPSELSKDWVTTMTLDHKHPYEDESEDYVDTMD